VFSEDIGCVFNGEIYNVQDFSSAGSEVEALIEAYSRLGTGMFSHLDGEFAVVIVDYKKKIAVISSDCFGTKPIWAGFAQGEFACASYASALKALGFKDIRKVRANETWIVSLVDWRVVRKQEVVRFNLNQFKESYDDWIYSFEEAIKKRVRGLQHKLFVCVSSGYDSGAITCELERQSTNFKAFIFPENENSDVLGSRISRFEKRRIPFALFKFDRKTFAMAKENFEDKCEDYEYDGYRVRNEGAGVGLAHMFQHARDEGFKIVLSGQGADEILSDYGMGGKKLYWHSELGGVFPQDLAKVFPWPNVFGRMQERYLAKEECIAGAFGIETRYPFLDKKVVQEFLNLSSKLKNNNYKAPIHEYLSEKKYPFEANSKRGFAPDLRVKSGVLVQARQRVRNWLREL
jgi:asparagine synthase (glutamine-hydrolysing)